MTSAKKTGAESVGIRYRIALSWVFALMIGFMIMFAGSAWENPLLGGVLFCAGCGLAGVAALGRMWCSLYISGYKNDVLVTDGPYSACRNPLYFFSLLGAVGIGLTTKTFIVPAIILGLFAVYYPAVIRSEERRLLSIHGERFEEYLRTTPAFFPRLSGLKEPAEYVVNPRIFSKNLTYAFWFVGIVGLIELIGAFHQSGLLPVYLRIY